MSAGNLLLAAGLLISLGGCASTTTNTNESQAKTADTAEAKPTDKGVVCRQERQTGSMVYRRVCRPADDPDRRAADQESMRRSQVNTRRPGPQ